MPRLLQEALWLGLAGQQDRAHSEDESRKLVLVEGRIGSGSALSPGTNFTWTVVFNPAAAAECKEVRYRQLVSEPNGRRHEDRRLRLPGSHRLQILPRRL